MKKLFAIFAVAAIVSSCNDTKTKTAADSDSARAVKTADSLAAIKVVVDTTAKPMVMDSLKAKKDSPAVKAVDTVKKAK